MTQKALGVLMFLICFPQLGFGQLSCMMKKDVNTTQLNLGNNTLAHLKVEDGRNASFIHVFECKCNPNELGIVDVNAINTFRSADEYWYRAEVLRITNCAQLEVRLQKTLNGIADYMDKKVLMIEYVTDLRLVEFLVGTPTGNPEIGTFSSFYFRNVTITSTPSFLAFGDRHEVAFERIRFSDTYTSQFKIQIDNKDPQVNPVFRIEDSRFRGIDDFAQVTTRFFQILVDNKQKTEQQCSFRYKGVLILARNRFGFVGLQDIFVKGGERLDVVNNTFDVLHEYGMDIRNVKTMNVTGNNFGVVTKKPFLIAEYDKYVSGCSESDLTYDDIKNNTFSDNVFVNLKLDDIQFDDPDQDFPTSLVNEKFRIENNGIFKPCDCYNLTEIQANTLTQSFYKTFMNGSLCLTHHQPPILGNKTDICNGNVPRDSTEYEAYMKQQQSFELMHRLRENIETEKKHNVEKRALTGGLSAGIILFVIAAVVITVFVIKKC